MPRSGEWFSSVVYEAVDLGLMGGYTPDDGGAPVMFGAYDSLTCGQLALVLYRMVNGEEPDGAAVNETTFADNPDAQYFTAAVNWAAKEGILKGSGAGGTMLVRPNDPVTRQELATMIYRFAQAQGVDMTADSSALADKTDAASIADWRSRPWRGPPRRGSLAATTTMTARSQSTPTARPLASRQRRCW